MPYKAAHPCAQPGCPELVHEGRFCPTHRRQQWRARAEESGTASQRGYGSAWRKLRLLVLGAQPLCADPFGIHEADGQVVVATDVDHIVPKAHGGDDSMENLQPLCRDCHQRKSAYVDGFMPGGIGTESFQPAARLSARRWARSSIPVTIVAGPPGSGKTTYVKEHSHWGDLIVDVDALYAALSGLEWYEKPISLLPFALAARDALIARLAGAKNVRHAWVITSEGLKDRLYRLTDALGAELIVLDVLPLECMARIAADDRRKDRADLWQPIVSRWWEEWERITSSAPGPEREV